MRSARNCSCLADRLTAFATERYGGLECRQISGVQWPVETASDWAMYYSGGGAERCAQFITEAAQAYLESIGPPSSMPGNAPRT
jgi:hypothetical protein